LPSGSVIQVVRTLPATVSTGPIFDRTDLYPARGGRGEALVELDGGVAVPDRDPREHLGVRHRPESEEPSGGVNPGVAISVPVTRWRRCGSLASVSSGRSAYDFGMNFPGWPSV
jgi:hypothetical protein